MLSSVRELYFPANSAYNEHSITVGPSVICIKSFAQLRVVTAMHVFNCFFHHKWPWPFLVPLWIHWAVFISSQP